MDVVQDTNVTSNKTTKHNLFIATPRKAARLKGRKGAGMVQYHPSNCGGLVSYQTTASPLELKEYPPMGRNRQVRTVCLPAVEPTGHALSANRTAGRARPTRPPECPAKRCGTATGRRPGTPLAPR